MNKSIEEMLKRCSCNQCRSPEFQPPGAQPAPEQEVSAEFKRPDDTEGGTCD